MNSFKNWLQDHLGLIQLVLLLFVGPNLYSAYRILWASLVLILAHIIMAVVLLLGAVLIH